MPKPNVKGFKPKPNFTGCIPELDITGLITKLKEIYGEIQAMSLGHRV